MAFSIYYQNVRGLRSKTSDFKSQVLANNYDIVVLTETWLLPSINSSELFDARYNVYRRDRDYDNTGQKYGGGVLIAVNNKFNSVPVIVFHSQVEDLWVKITISHGGLKSFLYLCSVYIPPSARTTTYACVFDKIKDNFTHLKHSGHLLIFGDFNISEIEWVRNQGNSGLMFSKASTVNAHLLVNTMSYCGLSQFNDIVNVNNKILDLVLSDLIVSTQSCSVNSLTSVDSYHPPLECEVEIEINDPIKPIEYKKYCFNKANYVKINQDLLIVNWSLELNNLEVDEAVEKLYRIINKIISVHVPQHKKSKQAGFPVWFSKELIALIRSKNKLRKRFKRYGSVLDYIQFSRLRKEVKLMSKQCYKSYIQSTEENIKLDPKIFWSFVKSNQSNQGIPSVMQYGQASVSDPRDICNIFSDYFASVFEPDCSYAGSVDVNNSINPDTLHLIQFSQNDIEQIFLNLEINKSCGPDGISPLFIKRCAHALAYPLSLIYNKSLRTGIFPSYWKLAYVTPIFKSGDKSLAQNYRPISKLSVFGKCFEALINRRLIQHVENLISEHQHGFLPGRSTTTNLLSFTNYLKECFANRLQVDAVYTDFSKAFDKVNRSILVQKLIHYGINNPLLSWFTSYLTNREQQVVIYGHKSNRIITTSGVPQGSHLGPTLFLLFINDLCNQLRCNYLLYADDLKVYRRIVSVTDAWILQKDLDMLNKWCNKNKLFLNIDKCCYIHFTSNRNIIFFDYKINGIYLKRENIVKDLGVLLDTKLSFVPHIDAIVSKAFRMLGFVLRITKDFADIQALKLLFFTHVRSILEYACSIWSPCYTLHIHRIESIQRRFTKIACRRVNINVSNYKERAIFLGMASLEDRRKILDLNCLYKIINNYYKSNYLTSLLLFNVPQRHLRSTSVFRLPTVFTNISFYSPIFRMMRTFNETINDIDSFSQSLMMFKRLSSNIITG